MMPSWTALRRPGSGAEVYAPEIEMRVGRGNETCTSAKPLGEPIIWLVERMPMYPAR